jgi:hypothetical protein
MDERKRVVDFHALRHSYITILKTSGANPTAAQKLARHSSSALTDRYTDMSLDRTSDALSFLPDLGVPACEQTRRMVRYESIAPLCGKICCSIQFWRRPSGILPSNVRI